MSYPRYSPYITVKNKYYFINRYKYINRDHVASELFLDNTSHIWLYFVEAILPGFVEVATLHFFPILQLDR